MSPQANELMDIKMVIRICIYERYLQCLRVAVSIMYADDTHVQISRNTITYLVSSLNVELELLSRWLKANKLSLNVQNNFFLLFHREKIKDHDICIQIDESTLTRSTNIKYLGGIIDHKLNRCENTAMLRIRYRRE